LVTVTDLVAGMSVVMSMQKMGEKLAMGDLKRWSGREPRCG
jgi:hypothetical protein